MTKEQKYKEVEKIWRKHATGRTNMIATFLPHANQVAFFNELVDFFTDHPELPYPNIQSVDDVRKAVKEVIKEGRS